MKVKVLALAVAAMALTIACNNNKAAEVEDTMVEDTTVIEEMVDEEVADSITVAVAEETPAAKPAAKPAVKKDEPKVVNNEDGTKTVTTTRGSKKVEEESRLSPLSPRMTMAPRLSLPEEVLRNSNLLWNEKGGVS